jgi:hypothetical protein
MNIKKFFLKNSISWANFKEPRFVDLLGIPATPLMTPFSSPTLHLENSGKEKPYHPNQPIASSIRDLN